MESKMTMERSEAVCLSCVRLFDARPNANLRVCNYSNQRVQLYKKLQHFAKEHLKLPPPALNALNAAISNSGGGVRVEEGGVEKTPMFCVECENSLSVICNLYDGLCKVQVELANKIGKWGEKLESHKLSKGESKKWDQFVLLELAQRMNLKGGEAAVEEIRNQIASRCKQRSALTLRLPPPTKQVLPKLVPAPTIPSSSIASTSSSSKPNSNQTAPKIVQKIAPKIVQKIAPKPQPTLIISKGKGPNLDSTTTTTIKKCSITRTKAGVVIERNGKKQNEIPEPLPPPQVIINKENDNNEVSRSNVSKKSAAMEALQATLPRDIEVLEVDESSLINNDNEAPSHSPPSSNSHSVEGIRHNDVKIEFNEEDEDPEEHWFGDFNDDPLSITEAVDFPKHRKQSNNPTSSQKSSPNTIMLSSELKVDTSFFDESDNNDYRASQQEDNQDDNIDYRASPQEDNQDAMMLPLDVSIEEVDESFSGQYSSPDSPSSLSGIQIVGVTGRCDGPSATPPKRRKMVHVTNLDPSAIPDDIPGFVDFFKRRRRELGLTQNDVAKSFGTMFGQDDELFSQTTVSRFEAVNLTEKNMEKLKPLFQRWLEVADPIQSLSMSGALSENPKVLRRRKRTTIDKVCLEWLDEYFLQNSTPQSEEITEIAQQLNLEKEVVRVWFCNRRQKHKKTLSNSNSDSFTEPQPQTLPQGPIITTTTSFQSAQPQFSKFTVLPPGGQVQPCPNVIVLKVHPSFLNLQ